MVLRRPDTSTRANRPTDRAVAGPPHSSASTAVRSSIRCTALIVPPTGAGGSKCGSTVGRGGELGGDLVAAGESSTRAPGGAPPRGGLAAPRRRLHPDAPRVGADREAAPGRDPHALRLARRQPGPPGEPRRGGPGAEARRHEGRDAGPLAGGAAGTGTRRRGWATGLGVDGATAPGGHASLDRIAGRSGGPPAARCGPPAAPAPTSALARASRIVTI